MKDILYIFVNRMGDVKSARAGVNAGVFESEDEALQVFAPPPKKNASVQWARLKKKGYQISNWHVIERDK